MIFLSSTKEDVHVLSTLTTMQKYRCNYTIENVGNKDKGIIWL